MGAYNTLDIKVRCTNCKNVFPGKLQFKAGDTRQYEYTIGDRIKVDQEDLVIIGKDIVAYGILENEICPFCGHGNKEEYNIYIDNCVITSVDDAMDLSRFLDANEGRWYFKHQL